MYDDECPHCGHEKGAMGGSANASAEEGSESVAQDSEESEPVEDVEEVEEDEPVDVGVDYEELVQGTIPEVKDAIKEEGLDLAKVLKAEKENKDRVTLKDWLEEQMVQEA